MIYTLTVNPAVDYHMDLTGAGLHPGEINRSAGEEIFPGGKGLNVSVMLAELGIESIAWGFIAGKTGALLEALAVEKGCRCDFIRLPEGETRINVKLDCEQETAINGNGPLIGAEQADALLARIKDLLPGDMMILSGNLQAGSIDLYQAICREAEGKDIRIIVDTEGDHLTGTFPYHPFLIKPNREELLALFGQDVNSTVSPVPLMEKCREGGVRNVLLTMGGEGALLLTEEGNLYRAKILKEHRIVSTVGAGDSTIAGFLAGLSKYPGDYAMALKLACAAGTASACRKWLGSRAEIESLTGDIEVCRL